MKKPVLIGLIGILSVALLLIISCIRPIIPGSYVGIVYPAPDAVVPTEFSVLAVAAKWSFGVETYPFLFLGAPKSRVGLPPCMVELSLDGAPYARSGGGNHHVFRITAPPGDHTLGLATPYGKTEIAVHVTDDPPVVFTPFDRAEEYAELADGLTRALYDYTRNEPSPFSENTGGTRFQKIFLCESGAFILFGLMQDQYMAACEVRFIAPIGGEVAADDIKNAPAIFSWDAASWQRPVKLAVTDNGGDRLFMAVFDNDTLTVFSVFPGGRVDRSEFSLSDVAPGLADCIRTSFSAYIVTKANRDALFFGLDAYQMKGQPGHFDLLFSGGMIKSVDLNHKYVDGITPSGDLITLYPASFVGPFDTTLVGGAGPVTNYLALPEIKGTFSFTGGSVHVKNVFDPEYPRFEVGPPVPCIGCTKEYAPAHYGLAGDVTFGPDILKTTLGGREAYFTMRQ